MTPKQKIREVVGLSDALAGKVPVTRTINGIGLDVNPVLTKSHIGLGSVDNTADTAKPVSTAQQAALDTKYDKAGGRVDSFVIVSVDRASAAGGDYFGTNNRTTNSPRWRLGSDHTAETGANAGSDFNLISYTDAGAFLSNALSVQRSTGKVTVPGALGVGNSVTVTGGIQSLVLTAGSHDHVYMGFFARTASPNVRSGFIGYPAAGSTTLQISNELAGPVQISASGGLTVGGGHVQPSADAILNLGASTFRWATAYFATNPIVSSDARLKTVRGDGLLTEQEVRWWGRNRHRVYQYTAAVQEKGAAAARLHVGLIAQEVRDNAVKEGLDPGRYALWCEDPVLAPVTRTRSVERTAMETVMVPTEEITVKDGRAVRRMVDKPVTREVTQVVPLFHANGKPVIVQQAITANGVETTAAVQATYTAPVRETVLETYEEQAPTGETRLGLRYEQCLIMEAAFLRSALNLVFERLFGRELCGAEALLSPKAPGEVTVADKVAADAREACRRIAALFGAPVGLEELMDKKVSASARATSLAAKKADNLPLTLAEAAEEKQLNALFANIEAIRAAEKTRAAEITAGAAVLTPWPA